jgi:glutaredoxin
MAETTLTLLGKPGCHLCDDAKVVVDRVVAELAADGRPVQVVERSILDDPELERRFHDDIPVVLIDGRVHGRWRFDAERLRAAVLESA